MEITGFKIEQSGIIDLSKHKLINGAAEFKERLSAHEPSRERTFNNPIDPNHPLNAPYAEVIIPGKNGRDSVVKIDNNSFTQTPNSFYQQYGITPDQLGSIGKGLPGPEAARLRAEKIAELTGGSIKLAPTAITEPNQYPTSFTYTQEELASKGIMSPAATLKAEIARFKFQLT